MNISFHSIIELINSFAALPRFHAFMLSITIIIVVLSLAFSKKGQ